MCAFTTKSVQTNVERIICLFLSYSYVFYYPCRFEDFLSFWMVFKKREFGLSLTFFFFEQGSTASQMSGIEVFRKKHHKFGERDCAVMHLRSCGVSVEGGRVHGAT